MPEGTALSGSFACPRRSLTDIGGRFRAIDWSDEASDMPSYPQVD
jgi:hypothetical protein